MRPKLICSIMGSVDGRLSMLCKMLCRNSMSLSVMLAMTFFISGCSEEPEKSVSDEPVIESLDDNTGNKEENPENKILIVYFSRTGYNYPNQWLDTGHTARVAGFISDLTGGDKFELVPEIPYPDNYQETVEIARKELDNDTRPKFKGAVDNFKDYNIVFVGGPVWHGCMPMIIRTFYDTYDLTDKTIVPFSTHAGSGLGDCERLARSYYPEGNILSSLAVQGTNSANSKPDVEKWLKNIGIIK